MIPEWQKGIVRSIEDATYNTRRYWIELPGTQRFDFKPGQFVTIDLPIHEQRNKRWRSYSIASAPDGGNVIELVIVLVDGGSGSTYFFEQVKVGTELTLRGPHGVFVLPEPIEKELFMICTGTGIAPFRSMLHYIHENKLTYSKLHLIFGTRTQKDLLYADEMHGFEKLLPSFTYYPTLSREEWDGLRGYVHSVYEALCEKKPDADFMLCGWRNMIDEAKHRILDLGYDKKAIHLELYG
ncbi:ferredoxin--NADP reductase [Polluticoccus soli]|uniref:ferredoxin--NADP reductase n=1 Tax=Polluticoccus soli TaxID=3034150 RepID=UPI0023E26762|nr:FAD-binding oxidoreductase [Flavipsychrobacter sp. JY13-12]